MRNPITKNASRVVPDRGSRHCSTPLRVVSHESETRATMANTQQTTTMHDPSKISIVPTVIGLLLALLLGVEVGCNSENKRPQMAPIEQDETDLEAAIRAAIETVFRAQQDAWNRGDVEAFMEHYWKSDDLTFSSGGKTTRGWQATRDNYEERYPTRDAMGRLTLGEFELFPLGDSAALVLGEWKLDRESEPVSGNFSLVLRKIDGRWVIVHDHTSRLAE
jgi:ketosteroid isomerase-like protein